MNRVQLLSTIIFGLIINIGLVQAANFEPLKGQTAVRVCADKYNLPYSNKELQGFDNKIADIIGEELGLPVEYYWFPQRIGFSRNTIKKVDEVTGRFKCDLAMSVPASPGILMPTVPYFSSIEALVYRTGEGFELNTLSDIAKVSKEHKELRIGLFDRGVATAKLLELGLADQIEYFQMMTGDARVNAGRIVSEALASGEVDVVVLWGPIAGYYASQSDVAMKVVPLNELGDRFVFSFAMGTRRQDKNWRLLLNDIIAKRKDDITAIISEYNLPSTADVIVLAENEQAVYRVENGKVDDKTYVGWRLFNSTCFVCHGRHATGTSYAPNLLHRVKDMTEEEFKIKLLRRYFEKVNLDDPEMRFAFLEQIAERDTAEFKMPTWADDPNIRPHISHLYSYLKARADGALGEDRPERFEK
ncbi:MAG: hypothetical protein ACKE9I_09600 [Methylophagaceae bacterium]